MEKRHVISTAQFFDRPILEKLFAVARQMEEQVVRHQVEPVLSGRFMASLFYEPSTRTRFSFEAAMQHLGGSVISTEAAGQFSSMIKGETLEDSIRVTAGYVDAIVLRHPETGAAERAAAVSDVPIINAGDGNGEHPTQALLDIYTIQAECGRIDGLKVALVGDILNSRTIHSLLFLLGLCSDIEVLLISPKQLRLPDKYKQYLDEKHMPYQEFDRLDCLDESIDVMYMTRVQKERFKSVEEYEKLKAYFVVGKSVLSQLKAEARILDPLPRVGTILEEVDSDARAAYFRQARNGLYVRMALLREILKQP
jgi:aspartate carbamoyltransferase catalytic subunit